MTIQSDKLPSYLRPLLRFQPARPSTISSGPGSDVSGLNPKHLEASRSIFSSQCMQNRHQAQSRCKLLLLQKTIFVALTNTGQRPVADRSAARPERSAKGATASGQDNGGAERDRTADPLLAKQVLSQLSYSPSSSITSRYLPKVRQQSASPAIPSSQIHHSHMQMVGPGRLELPTPRLSSVCSNQLSYGPIRGTGRRGFLSF
jgi:hypothetical protein